jgi:hypothetical protein
MSPSTSELRKHTNSILVGPGHYNPVVSEFEKIGKGAIISAPRKSLSPRVRAAAVNPGVLKLGSPSIPSKFCTPVIDKNSSAFFSDKNLVV